MALSSYRSASNQAVIERVKTRFLSSYAIDIRVFKSFEKTLTLTVNNLNTQPYISYLIRPLHECSVHNRSQSDVKQGLIALNDAGLARCYLRTIAARAS